MRDCITSNSIDRITSFTPPMEGVGRALCIHEHGGGLSVIWLDAEHARAVRRALDAIYPEEGREGGWGLDPAAEEVLIRYADEHGHEHNKVPAVNA